MKLKSGPSEKGESLRRTFPAKGKSVKKGKCTGLSKREAKKQEDKGTHKKDSFLVNILEKEGIKCTQEIEQIVHRKCYILLHGIARVDKEELMWDDEQKNELFFSRVSLSYLKIEMHPSHAENILGSHLTASYSFFKFLISTGGILTSAGSIIFMNLLLKSNESEMSTFAIHMNALLHTFSSAFGMIISSTALLGRSASKLAFNERRDSISEELSKICNGISDRVVEKRNGKDLPSDLADLYCEIDNNRLPIVSKKKVFETSDDEEENGTNIYISNAGVMANIKMEEYEMENTITKKMIKVKEECEEMKMKTEIESIQEKETNNKKKKDSKSCHQNHWEEEEKDWNSQPSTSNSMSDEFRSNLVELAQESWKKSVAFYSIENEPSVKDRFKMARFIIESLENTYGDELLEILQFFTFQSFEPGLLTEPEEVVGLILYLDQRKLIADSFFFLLLAMNKKKCVRVALNESEICCRAQLKAAKICRSVLLGKPLQAQQLVANRDALNKRRDLESNKYHILFEGIIKKDSMKKIFEMKKDEEREMKKEILKNTAFTDDFWVASSKLFHVDSNWSTYDVSESAVRVFGEMNKIFKGSLTNIIRTMCGRIPDSAFSDPSSLQSLTSLHRMKKTGFFDGSLLFALLRFNDANAMKKSCSKLSKLCDGFKKVIDAGAKSEGLKTDSSFLSMKHSFSERAMKVNAECMKFFNVLMNSKGRKRCLSTSSTVERIEEREEIEKSPNEPRKKKRKENNEDIEKYIVKGKKEGRKEANGQKEGDDNGNNAEVGGDEKKRIEKESKKEEKSEKRKKKNKEKLNVKEEETSEIEECHIIEVDTKKVKVEVISSDEEGENGEKRRLSKRSLDGDVSVKVERAYEFANHKGSRKCVELLFNHIKKTNPSVRPIVSGPAPSSSMEGSIPSPNESLWRYNSKWLVTTFWSDSREDWEKIHSSDMDRLSHRISNFMLLTAMREEHYMRKLKVLEWIKTVLKDELEKTESTLDITGSSLCSVGASNSNLDLFFHVAKGRAEKEVLLETLTREQGIELRLSKGPKIHMVITNEYTEGVPMLVSIHLIFSTPYMGRVYQMVDSQDERVAALSLVLKAWRIVEPSCSSAKIQSYHLMNLLIHFLQCGVSPPILPSLNRLYPHLDPLLYRQHGLPPPILHENTQSLASLLIGFFTYYSQFDFEKYIISIREGYLFKRKVSDEGSKKVIMMEPPFENYRLRPQCVTTDVEYCSVRAACRRTLESLTTSFNIPSLPNL